MQSHSEVLGVRMSMYEFGDNRPVTGRHVWAADPRWRVVWVTGFWVQVKAKLTELVSKGRVGCRPP